MFDLVIRGGLVFDGLGNAPERKDIAIRDGVIVRVGDVPEKGAREIDATGLSVSPGFIDSHSHADRGALNGHELFEVVEQGITTSITGQCGGSIYPVVANGKEQSAEEFFAHLGEVKSAMNFSLLIGNGTLRNTVMGKAMRAPTAEELAAMQKLLADALDAGAMGLSLGLIYVPGAYAKTDELKALASVLTERGGVMAAHIRNEADDVEQAVDEYLDIAKSAGVTSVISHFKACRAQNHGKVVKTIAQMEAAVNEGYPIYADVYPYVATSTTVSATFVTRELLSLPVDEIVAELKKPEVRAAQKAAMIPLKGADLSFVLITVCPGCPQYVGKRLSEIAAEKGVDMYEACYDVLCDSNLAARACYFTINENDMRRVLSHPRVMVGTDSGSTKGQEMHHPRCRGTFPRAVGKYAREEGVVPMAEMIRKMTSLPATVYGLETKGRIAEGFDADLCLFDAATIRDTATFTAPRQTPVGIRYVIVNGEIAVEDGKQTAVRAGRFISMKNKRK